MQKDEPILDFKYKKSYKRTRGEKRRMKIEIDHFVKNVEPIELEFIDEVLEENNLSYREIYLFYLEKLRRLCQFLNENKYKVIEVDAYFFVKKYKPIEKPQKKVRIFDALRV